MSDPESPGRPAGTVLGWSRWHPAVAVAAVVLVASVVDPGPAGGQLPDGLSHVLAYATLAATVAHATRESPTLWRAGLALGGATAYGLAVELLQVPIPYREFATADLLANALGAALGLLWLSVEPYVDHRDHSGD